MVEVQSSLLHRQKVGVFLPLTKSTDINIVLIDRYHGIPFSESSKLSLDIDTITYFRCWRVPSSCRSFGLVKSTWGCGVWCVVFTANARNSCVITAAFDNTGSLLCTYRMSPPAMTGTGARAKSAINEQRYFSDTNARRMDMDPKDVGLIVLPPPLCSVRFCFVPLRVWRLCRVVFRRLFQMQDCPERPTHGYDGEPATFCQAHMAQGMKVGRGGEGRGAEEME